MDMGYAIFSGQLYSHAAMDFHTETTVSHIKEHSVIFFCLRSICNLTVWAAIAEQHCGSLNPKSNKKA